MDVPLDYSIIDKRKATEFSDITFSHYPKADVIKKMRETIINGKLEEACYWFVEIHISGKLDILWKEIINIMTININIENPYLSSWLWMKFKKYNKILEQFNRQFIYENRNNQEIRNLLTDVISVITLSNKNAKLKSLPKLQEKDLNNSKNRLVAKNYKLVENMVSNEDDDSVIMASNEIAHLLINYNYQFQDVLYWYMWLVKMDGFKKKNNLPINKKKRLVKNVNEKYYYDWIWLIWEIILTETERRNDDRLENEIHALYNFYRWKYSNKTSKQNILFNAIMLLKCKINWWQPVIRKYEYRIQAICNINQIYRMKQDSLDVPPSLNEKSITNYLNENKNDKVSEMKEIREKATDKKPIKVKTPKKAAKIKIENKRDKKLENESKSMEKMQLMSNLIISRKKQDVYEDIVEDEGKNNDEEIENYTESIIKDILF